MKKIFFALLASAFLFASCGDDDSKDNNSTPQNNNNKQNEQSDEVTQAIDYDAFCNVIMGKACGDNISDADMKNCVDMYKAEYDKHLDCAEPITKYYKCVIDIKVTPCAEGDEKCECIKEDACKAENEAIDPCLKEKYPNENKQEEIDYDAFCNVIMGKACGANISDADMKNCVDMYKAEYDKHLNCAEPITKYYKCVINTKITPCAEGDEKCECIEDDACKAENEAIDPCLKEKYPNEDK